MGSDADIDRTLAATGDARADTLDADALARTLAALPSAVSGARDEPAAFTRGDLVGRYVVLDRLGQGGMGVVYAAYDPELDRKVALKLVLARRGDDPGAHARLLREAQALAQLAHPNVVTVHDVGTLGDRVWIAMEFVAGLTLSDWLAQRQRGWRELLPVFVRAGEGLHCAHAAGLVHRDFKPDNVMVSPDGRVRVMDFGLARPGQPAPGDARDGDVPHDLALTGAGALLGTPLYMAPEQWSGAALDARADQFAFCVALWSAVFGAPPFRGDTMPALADAVTRGRIEPARRDRGVPSWLHKILQRGLSTDPARRFPSMAALLQAIADGQTSVRRRLLALALLTLVGVGLAALAWQRHAHHQRALACDAAGAAIAGVWNEGSSSSLRAALIATGVPYAASTADRVLPRIDAWTAAWRDARTRVCREAELDGTRSREHHALAAACLDDRRDELAALLGVLAEADAAVVPHAVPAAAGLSLLAPCSERAALERRPAPPTDEAARLRVQALRRDLMRVHGLFSAGRYADGLARAKTLLAAAEAEAYPPLVAEAAVAVGRLAYQTDDLALAEQLLTRAFTDAGAIGADETAASAALELVFSIGYGDQRHAEALQWAQAAEMLIRRIDQSDGLLGATLLNNRGTVHAMRGAYDDALDNLARALEIRRNVLGPAHPVVGDSLGNVGEIHRIRGELDLARETQQQALAQRETVLGPDHPDTAIALNNLAITYIDRQEPAFARTLLERAVAIWEAVLGPDHVNVANGLTNLANAHGIAGDYDQALAVNARAIAVWEKAAGFDHPRAAYAIAARAEILQRTGDFDGALELYQRALGLQEKALGPDHPDLAFTLGNLASVHVDRGAAELALEPLARSLAIFEQAHAADHPNVAAARVRLADALVRLGRADEAVATLEQAIALLASTRTEPLALGQARFALARALAAGERARALELAEAAAEACRGAGPAGAARLAEIEAWLREKRAG